MINVIEHLKAELTPFLEQSEFNLINNNKEFFIDDYLTTYTCKECHKLCVFETKDKDYDCPTGYFEETQEIPLDNLKRYKFDIFSFLKIVAGKNNIISKPKAISSLSYFIGEKQINNVEYKFFYTIRMFDGMGNLFENTILSTRYYFETKGHSIIITPDDFLLTNEAKSFLKDNCCKLISLKELINNNFLIKNIPIASILDIETLIKCYELVILNSKEIYIYGIKVKLSNQCFKLLSFLASIASVNITRNECIIGTWGKEAAFMGYDKKLYDTCSLIRSACRKADIEQSKIENLIVAKDGCIILNVKPERIHT